ncbi:mitochondrial ornithine transporter 1 [Oratosquilla oratoria]|uniref:mitochondrial ornithine transporter 1 n=1 Tax=Oratosquilla oratoria TaxID=337810 RepID=UPI003F76FC75
MSVGEQNNASITGGKSGSTALQTYKDAFTDLMAGSMGGVASVYVGQPLDTVKVKMQTFPDMYKNMVKCFTETFRREGIRGLYAGTVPALAANIAENSVLFAAYGVCQKGVAKVLNAKDVNDLSPLSNATAGFFAAFFSSLTLCPTELVKCKLQAMRETALLENKVQERIGPWKLTRQILQTEGIPGMFRGLTSTFAREMPGYFFFFGGYELSRTLLTPKGKTKDEIGPFRTVLCGGIAGVTLWVAIFPADVVKSRIQVAGSTEPMMKVMKGILRNEGLMALYNGLGPTVIRTFPATGALFLAVEMTKKFMHGFLD